MKPKYYWYMIIMRKNHTAWWLEDNVAERLHIAIDRLDGLYWDAVMRLGGF